MTPGDRARALFSGATPAERGYRLHTPWSDTAAVWVEPPQNPETWPGCLDRAQQQHANWVDAMRQHGVAVRTVSGDANHPTDDAWLRDFGPLFLKNPDRTEPLALDFRFNAWGGKYEGARPNDDAAGAAIARAAGVSCERIDYVLEGGSIETDGRGTLLTTEPCLLNPNRNGPTDKPAVEAVLRHGLGVDHVVWLPGEIAGDDTDGHVDEAARFAPDNAVLCVSAPPGHPDHLATQANRTALQSATNAHGERFHIVPLPAPEPLSYDFPPDEDHPSGPAPIPASYANFLATTRAVFVPVFGQPTDDDACRAIETAFPGRTVVPIRAEWLIVGLGSLHCLSLHQPA
ncbi:MAG: agmatine deiminase family protein [Planctomycetota bacterium]